LSLNTTYNDVITGTNLEKNNGMTTAGVDKQPR